MSLAVQMIRSLDLFSATPVWYVRGNPTSTSTSGITFTFLMVGFLIWAAIYLSNDLRLHENSKVTENLLLGVGLDYTYDIKSPEFTYVFGLLNSETGKFYYNTSILTANGIVVNNNGSSSSIGFVPCAPEDINKNIPYEGSLICIDPKIKNLTISGLNALLTLDFSLCKNSTENNYSCAPQEEIDAMFDRQDQFYVFFPIHSVITWNYSTPIIKSWNYQNFFVDNSMTKRISMVLKKILLLTDTGLFTNYDSIINITAHEQFFFDIGARVPGSIFSVEIFTNGNMNYISRKYPKLQEFLGQFTGLTHALLFILTLLVVPFTRMKMFQYLGREAFHLQMEKKEKLGKKFDKVMLDNNYNTSMDKKNSPQSLHINEDIIVTPASDNQTTNGENIVTSPRDELLNHSPENRDLMKCSIENDFLYPHPPSRFKPSTPRKKIQIEEVIRETLQDLNPDNDDKDEDEKVIELDFSKESAISSSKSSIRKAIEEEGLSKEEEKGEEANGEEEITEGVKNQENIGSITEPAGSLRNRFCCKRKTHRDKMLGISYIDWLFSGIRKTPQILLAEKLTAEITSRLDVKTVIRKFLEIDLLKSILLTENQLIIFENVCKPKIKMDYCHDLKKKVSVEYRTEKLLETFWGKKHLLDNAYHELKAKQHKSKIDVELLDRYHKKIKRGKKMQTQVVVESWRDI